MKKYWILISVGVLAAAALLILFPWIRGLLPVAGRGVVEVISVPRALYREFSLDELIPDRTGLMIRVRSAEYIWGRLVRELSASPLWREERIEERLEAARKNFEARSGFGIDRSRIMEVAGQDLALAVVPSGGVSPEAVLLLSRLGTRARLMEIFLRLGDTLKEEGRRLFQEEVYRGEKIVTVETGDDFPVPVAYCLLDGYLAAAVSDNPASLLREVIDLSRGEGDALAASRDFTAALDATGFSPSTLLECYLRPEGYPSGLGDYLPPGDFAEAAVWAEVAVQSLETCRAIGFRAGYREGARTRLRVVLKGEDRSPTPDPVPGDRVSLPGGKMLYGFIAADPSPAVESLAGLLAALGFGVGDDTFPGLAGWEQESGLSLRRDILPVLGHRSGLVLGGLTGGEFLPVPPFALVSSVTDRAAAAAVMNSIVSWTVLDRGHRPVRETYNGVELTFFPGLLFHEPGYALSDNELAIAGSREMLKSVVDLWARPGAAVENEPLFARATAEFDPAAALTVYLDGKILLDSFRAAADWYFAYQRLDAGEPVVPESIYREKIAPLLDLLRIVRSASATLGREKNIVKQDCFLYIPE
ncbi:MAG: hypothetical protein P9M08_03535 [Candidatus Erginobacter occultus]|nr:hypothetical protein [Candidatus Erginobacter occultus]